LYYNLYVAGIPRKMRMSHQTFTYGSLSNSGYR
jgi:hypothetical protein